MQILEKLCFAPAVYNAVVEIHLATVVYETVKDRCHPMLLKVRGGTTRAKRQSRELKHPHETYKCGIDSVGCLQGCLMVTRGYIHHLVNIRFIITDPLEEVFDIGWGKGSRLNAFIESAIIDAGSIRID